MSCETQNSSKETHYTRILKLITIVNDEFLTFDLRNLEIKIYTLFLKISSKLINILFELINMNKILV